MQPKISHHPTAGRGFKFSAIGNGRAGYGSTAEEAAAKWRRAVGASAPAPTVALRSTRQQPVVSRSLADDDELYPALRGPIGGVIVDRPFLARGGWHKLQSDGVVTETPIIIGGRAVGRLGDGANDLRTEDNRLYLTIVLNGRLPGVADAVRAVEGGYVNFLADWRGQPDRYEFDGGHRVGILAEWALTPIILGSPEYGRGTCRRIYYPARA